MTLYIDCCPRKESRTRKIANALLEKLGDYEEIRITEMGLVPLDEKRLNERNALLESGKLDANEFALSRQFASADTIVIAAPYWDLSFPSALKIYIENIYITGIVSTYDSNGIPKGLCKAKELFYVTTAGGPYDGRYSFEYLKTLCQTYLGIPKVTLVKAEMLDVYGSDSEKIIDDVIKTM